MPKYLKVLQEPDPFLRQVSKEISDPTSKDIAQLIEDMVLTMRKEDGIGLAAPQVQHSIRLIVIETKQGAIPMINPVITKRSDTIELGEEGCLSVKGTYGMVERSSDVTVSFVDNENTKQTINAHGLFARVIQHEIDHLDGVLFIDRVEDFSRDEIPEYTPAL